MRTGSIVILDTEARRLLWRCRRGMKELDVLLERFARTELPSASREQREIFARFLELPDPMLVDYLLGQEIAPEPELAELARRISASPAAVPAMLEETRGPPLQCDARIVGGDDPEDPVAYGGCYPREA